MRRLTALLFAAALAFAAQVPRPVADVTIDPPPGGKPIRIRDYRGKTVLIAIINTECSSCIRSVGILSNIQKDYASRGVQVLAAAVNEGAITLIGPFIQRHRPGFPMGVLTRDATRRLADFTAEERPFVPMLIFVDKQGTVRVQVFGDSEFFKNEDRETRKVLDQMLNAAR
jgi:hypothetical protein